MICQISSFRNTLFVKRVETTYKIPDYEYVHRGIAKSGVTLTLLWLEYCHACSEFGEILQFDWAGDVAYVVNTDTGELIPDYVFVSSLQIGRAS